jgi:hypothetical protein
LNLRGRKWQDAGEDCTMKSFMNCFYGEQIKGDEMDGTCRTHGRNKKCYSMLIGKLKGRDYSKNLGVEGWIILD